MKLVLDTNVVIDWLVFDAPFMNPLREAVRDQRVIVVTHAPAIDELRRVLGYPALKLSPSRQQDCLEEYRSRATFISAATMPGAVHGKLPQGFPRCRDPDDDPFLILAYLAKADAVVSRDNALLASKRRTRKFGFAVLNVQQMIEAINGLHTDTSVHKPQHL